MSCEWARIVERVPWSKPSIFRRLYRSRFSRVCVECLRAKGAFNSSSGILFRGLTREWSYRGEFEIGSRSRMRRLDHFLCLLREKSGSVVWGADTSLEKGESKHWTWGCLLSLHERIVFGLSGLIYILFSKQMSGRRKSRFAKIWEWTRNYFQLSIPHCFRIPSSSHFPIFPINFPLSLSLFCFSRAKKAPISCFHLWRFVYSPVFHTFSK